MIAAHHDPGRRGEKRRRRLKEVSVPRVPTVAPRAPGTAAIADRTRGFAVVIIADMDHEIRTRGRRERGDAGKRPRDRIVAVLERIACREPASGIAEHQDALRIGTRQWKRLAVEHARYRLRRHRERSQPRTLNSAGFTLSNFWSGSERTAIGVGVPSNSTDGHASSVIARTLDVPSGPTSTHCDSTLPCAAAAPDDANATTARAVSRWRHPKFMANLSRGAGSPPGRIRWRPPALWM